MVVGRFLVEVADANDLKKEIDAFVEVTGINGLVFVKPPLHARFGYSTNILTSINPKWNASIEIDVENEGSTPSASLMFKLWDYEVIGSNKLAGETTLSVLNVKNASTNQEFVVLPLALNGTPTGASLRVKVTFLAAQKAGSGLSPLEEIATYERGSYQFKTFSSAAAKRQSDDVLAANTAARNWLNVVRRAIAIIKIENETLTDGAFVTVWYTVV